MAVVNRNSTAVANAVATPSVKNNPQRGRADLQEVVAVVTTAADDTVTSIGRFFRLPSNARVSNLLLTNAAATTAGAIDIGLYDTDGGAVVSQAFFSSAVALTAAAAEAEVKGESGTSYTTANVEKTIWELLNLTSDPSKMYDVGYFITTTFILGPTAIALKARFVA